MAQELPSMPTLLHFADSSDHRWGLGATIRLDSGEPCLLSIAQSGVRVKKSRLGFFGPVLYNEKSTYQAALTANALSLLFPDSLLSPGFRNPVLCAFTNAILHCSTCAEVAITLNEAIARVETQADGRESTPTKLTTADVPDILGKFGALMEKYPTAYIDETWLPASKDQMRLVFKAAWKMAPNAELRNHIDMACLFLSHFQPGIGPVPMDFKVPEDLSSESMAQLDRYVQLQKVALAEAEKDSAAMDEFINGQR
jgi:hypothetical protein